MVIVINTAKNRQQEFWRRQPVGLWSSWSVSDSEFHYLDSIINEPLILKIKKKDSIMHIRDRISKYISNYR